MTRFRSLRGRLTTAVSLVALAAVAVLTVAFNLVLSASLSADRDKALRTDAAAAATTVTVKHGRVRISEAPNDAAVDRQVWVYEGRRAIEHPAADRLQQRAANALAGRAHAYRDLPERDLRLFAAPVRAGGRQVGTVVVGESLRAYDRTTDVALLGSVALAVILFGTVLMLTPVLIGRALRPVQAMTRSAADWSEHGAAERFGATPRPDELSELAHTFDALLDRVAASLRHEQRLSAELSHELRTPLARIVAEVDLLQARERPEADRREAYSSIARSAEQMRSILDMLMAAARVEAGLDEGRCDVRGALDGLVRSWAPTLAERGVELEVVGPPGELAAGADQAVVERILAPLLDNAGRYARSRVRLSAAAKPGAVAFTVTDDGPGVSPEQVPHVFDPGTSAGIDGHQGAGLGLALARRLARAAGGDVELDANAGGPGARFRALLPG